MDETTRQELNVSRLALIDPSIRPAVAAVLKQLEATFNYRPLIDREVWRSPQKQLELFLAGRSKTRWGFHCATLPDGKPGSLAADICDADVGWGTDDKPLPLIWWFRLGQAAVQNRLGWGGFFGVPDNIKERLKDAFLSDGDLGQFKRWCLGWDPAHVQTTWVTITQAKGGLR